MLRLASSLLLVAGCTQSLADVTSPETTLATNDPSTVIVSKNDPVWTRARTLHVGGRVARQADANERSVFPVWLDGSEESPISLDVVATSTNDDSVRVALLGPLHDGIRDVIAAEGYSQPRGDVEITADVTTKGEHLLVVGSFELATPTEFTLGAYCYDCAADRIDVLSQPKDGALVVGRMLQLELAGVMKDRGDIQADVIAGPPGHPELASRVATVQASGAQLNAILPPSVQPGDDIALVVRTTAGEILDDALVARFVDTYAPLVRTDVIAYGTPEAPSITASGVVPMFEGVTELALRSEERKQFISTATTRVTKPGQMTNGFASFDTMFEWALEEVATPLAGEVLSVGYVNGAGDYQRLGCFMYGGGTTTCP
ncbi:hypothetical protein BH11MYX2_BH11MYX2_39210 [soil metagenome]